VQRPRRITPKSAAFHIIEDEVDIVVFSDDSALERVVARRGTERPQLLVNIPRQSRGL
jgi:hypothetical protein